MRNAYILPAITIACTLFVSCFTSSEQPEQAGETQDDKRVIVAYVGGFRGNLTENVNPNMLSQIFEHNSIVLLVFWPENIAVADHARILPINIHTIEVVLCNNVNRALGKISVRRICKYCI